MKKSRLKNLVEFLELLGMAALLPILTVLCIIIHSYESFQLYLKFGRKSKLVKKVCKKCYARCATEWNQSNHMDWQHGELTCMFTDRYGKIKTKDGAPEKCPYDLEHLMK